MARVSVAEVKNILKTNLSDSDIEAFINTANLLVTEELGDSNHSAARLKEIERYWTAHLIASTKDQQVQSEGTGGASNSYQGQTGTGLDSTYYGQHVKILDTTGKLTNIGKAVAKITTIKYLDS